MEMKSLSDAELDQLRVEVLTEQERRKALADIPDQIRELTAKFIDGGGNPTELE